MEWTPNDDMVRQILGILQDTMSEDWNLLKEAGKKVEQFRTVTPDYMYYLTYLFLNPLVPNDNIRLMSGILLKNAIKAVDNNASINFAKSELLKALITLTSAKLRNMLSSIVSSIVLERSVESWPEFSEHFPTILASKDEVVAENAVTTLIMICEDIEDVSSMNFNVDVLLRNLTDLLSMSNSKIRGKSVRCINHFLTKDTIDLYHFADFITSKLFDVWEDEDDFVRKEICGTFVLLIDHIEYLVCSSSIIEYMLKRTCDPSPRVALQACEFWLAFAPLPCCKTLLKSHLKSLLSILIVYMKHSEEELHQYGASDNTDEPDSPEEIRPLFHRTRRDSDDEIAENYDWTIRKCAAASLDALSVCFREDFLPAVIPILKNALEQPNWLMNEAGILGLGAVAEGCMDGISHFLPDVIPYLFEMLNSSEPAIKSITCWTLSRYSNWIVSQPQDNYLEATIVYLLKKMLDRNKKVQEAACSAYSVLVEEARMEVVPYIDLSLHAFVSAFEIYQLKSLIILYDSISTLAHVVGNYLDKPNYISLILPPLLNKWNLLQNEDKALLPLLECISYIIAALELGFMPYAEPVFDRARHLIEETLWKAEQHKQNPVTFEDPDKDFVTIALDLISSIVVGLKGQFSKFLTNGNLLPLVFQCIKDPCHEVRQSALALFGDLIKYCYAIMQPYVNDFIPIVIDNIDRRHETVCNNAIWAVGEICLKMEQGISGYISVLFPRLVEVLENPPAVKNAVQTAAVVLCCLGFVCPTQLAPQLPRFVRCCCLALREITDCTEKDSGFRGICQMITYNPQGALQDFIYFCDAVASWNAPKEDLRNAIIQILLTFKRLVGDESWLDFLNRCPAQLKERLHRLYGVV